MFYNMDINIWLHLLSNFSKHRQFHTKSNTFCKNFSNLLFFLFVSVKYRKIIDTYFFFSLISDGMRSKMIFEVWDESERSPSKKIFFSFLVVRFQIRRYRQKASEKSSQKNHLTDFFKKKIRENPFPHEKCHRQKVSKFFF